MKVKEDIHIFPLTCFNFNQNGKRGKGIFTAMYDYKKACIRKVPVHLSPYVSSAKD